MGCCSLLHPTLCFRMIRWYIFLHVTWKIRQAPPDIRGNSNHCDILHAIKWSGWVINRVTNKMAWAICLFCPLSHSTHKLSKGPSKCVSSVTAGLLQYLSRGGSCSLLFVCVARGSCCLHAVVRVSCRVALLFGHQNHTQRNTGTTVTILTSLRSLEAWK